MPDHFKVRKLKAAAKTNAARNGLLVFVTAYKKIAIATGSKNHQFNGAYAPDRTTPLINASAKLTIAMPQSFDLCLRLIHTAFVENRLKTDHPAFLEDSNLSMTISILLEGCTMATG